MITDSRQIKRIIDSFPFLNQGDDEFRRRFFQRATRASIEPGVAICHEGTQCSALSLVLSGSARVFKLSESGREITLYRIGPGGSCILTASCLVNARPFPAQAISEQAVEAVVIPADDVRRWMDESQAMRHYLFGLISERLGDVIALVEEVAFRRVDRRISRFLLARAEMTAGRSVKATHQEIASDLGTSREVVSRILKDLERQGCLTVSRGAIQVTNMQVLRAKANDV